MQGRWELAVLVLQLFWKSKTISKHRVYFNMSYWEDASKERPGRDKGASLGGRQGQ